MKTLPFTPNYLKNRGKNFDKNRHETQPEPKKKNVIAGAIKEASEVEPRLAEIKRKRGRPTRIKNNKEKNV